MKKLFIALLITTAVGLSSGCIASRKFVRNEVKTTADTLNSRIDTTDGEIKETRDHVDRVNERVTGVDGRVTDLDSRTTQGMNTLKGDVNAVNLKADAVNAKADETNNDLTGLDQRFQNRNSFSIAAEKSVPFKFDSARLDATYTADLDKIAEMLTQNADAIIVLEGRTDATGNHEYNVRLGERRVDSVRRYLAVEKGVPVYRIHEISLGAARPIASNDSRDGREKNRSVTITVLVPSMSQNAASNQ